MASRNHARSSKYAAALGMDDRTARRHLNQSAYPVDTGSPSLAAEFQRKCTVHWRERDKHMNQFLKLGLVRKIGSGPWTEYQIE